MSPRAKVSSARATNGCAPRRRSIAIASVPCVTAARWSSRVVAKRLEGARDCAQIGSRLASEVLAVGQEHSVGQFGSFSLITPISLLPFITAANGQRSLAMIAATSMMVSSWLTTGSSRCSVGKRSRTRLLPS